MKILSHQNYYKAPNINFSSKEDKSSSHFKRNILVATCVTGGLALADLFLTKGRVSSLLSKNKRSFIKAMSDDIDNVLAKDNYATKSRLEAFISTPGLHAVWSHRVAHKLHEWKIPIIPRLISSVSRFFTGIEIHPGAKLGKNLFIDHTGAIIGETAEIGNDVTIIGRAVLGSVGKGEYLRHTIVDDNVTIGMNSLMLGRIRLGKNAKIGAGAVVTHDVPQNVTIIGNPAKIITVNGQRLKNPLFLTKDSIKDVTELIKEEKL